MRKALTIIYLVFLILVIFIVQLLLVDRISIFGVKPNLILISVIVASLWFGIYVGSIYGVLTGIFVDILFGNSIGMFTISYAITGIIIGFFSYNYRKENKTALVYVTAIASAIFGLSQYVLYFINYGNYNSIIFLLFQIILTAILNIIIVYIVYKLLYKLLSFFENKLNMYDIDM